MYLKKARDMFVPFRVGDGDTAIFVAIELEDSIILIPGFDCTQSHPFNLGSFSSN